MANKQQDNWQLLSGVALLVWGAFWGAVKFVAGAALIFIVASMALKAAGVPFVTWRTLPIDQGTGVALAAMAYVLGKV